MIVVGAVAVLTADGGVGRVLDIVIFVLVTFPADRCGLVFRGNFFPLSLVGFSMPSVHVAPLVDTKITRY
jgi:hypothetical protein